ncbi:hypothetical protein C9303_30770 (plasmid) [Escherichia coli]|nr:hypothetical protein [Escherichia coli]RCA75732.1 hypothetical protein C6A61_17540 [Escherichia coli]RCB89069.1 hypothetical protein C6A92_27755 [Escherichia coli]RCC09806.1 hypothetical protein C6B20_27675 [Escherichia coli]RCE33455.1 hypothetical protein C6A57_18760 [Escherichia coli]
MSGDSGGQSRQAQKNRLVRSVFLRFRGGVGDSDRKGNHSTSNTIIVGCASLFCNQKNDYNRSVSSVW